MSSERRRFPRFGMELSVHFNGGDAEGNGSTTDLSAGGMFLYTETPLSLGSALELTLSLPQPYGDVNVSAQVLYKVDGLGYGISFPTPLDQHSSLRRFFNSLSSRAPTA